MSEKRMPMTPERYVEHIAIAVLASPDELCEPGEEGGDLYGVLVLACDRLGLDPQVVIDGVLAAHGRPAVESTTETAPSHYHTADVLAGVLGRLRDAVALPGDSGALVLRSVIDGEIEEIETLRAAHAATLPKVAR